MFLQFCHVILVIFITSSFAAHDASMKFPVTFADEKENKDHDNNQCLHDHVIEELDELHTNIKPLIDKSEMISSHMRGFKGQEGNEDWDLEPMFEEFYYNRDDDKRGYKKFSGAKGKKSLHDSELEDVQDEVLNIKRMRNPRLYYYFNDPLELDKRLKSTFQGFRGKKLYTSPYWEKKAAMNFQGFRGKRSMSEDLKQNHETLNSKGEKEAFVPEPYYLTNSYIKREPSLIRRYFGRMAADKRLRYNPVALRGKRNVIMNNEEIAESAKGTD